MTVRTIVFDFGNVIGYFSHRRASARLAAHSPFSQEELHARLFHGQMEDEYESGRLTTSEFLRRVHDAGKLRCSPEYTAEAIADIFWPNESVCALIPQLRPRYQLLLGSNTNDLHAGRFLKQFEPTLSHFDGIVLSHQVGSRKPHASFFEHCQRLAHGEPGQCLFIDDLPANVAGARALGWQGIVYRDQDNLVEQLAARGVELTASTSQTS